MLPFIPLNEGGVAELPSWLSCLPGFCGKKAMVGVGGRVGGWLCMRNLLSDE